MTMIDTPAPRPMVERLDVVRCALCGHPVSHYDATVPGAKAGGMCTRESCRKNPRTGKAREVYTFEKVIARP